MDRIGDVLFLKEPLDRLGVDIVVFDKFQSLRARSETDATGMGLSLVKRLVENQGGSIRVECEEDRGAAFRFYWPKERYGALVHA